MKRRYRKSRERGAVFVEALVVCAFFVTCFIGLVFFRELYANKLHVSRLARASALNYAMSACRSTPGAGLEGDLPKKPVGGPEQTGSKSVNASGDGKSDAILGGLDRSKSGGLFYSVAAIGVEAETRVESRSKTSTEPARELRGTVKTTSYVACGDVVTPDQYSEILPHLTSVFDSMF